MTANSMLVAQRRQASVAAPTVSVDGRSGHGDGPNEGDQAVRRYVGDAVQTDAANATTAFLCRHDDNGLVLGLTSAPALFRAADVSLVDLDLTGEAIAARADHRPAQFMQPGPGRLVAAQTEHPLEAQRTDAVLLAGDEPHGEKPQPQRLARVPATPFRRSAIPADRRLDSAAGGATFPTARPRPRSGGRQSHPASEAAGYTHGTPFRCQTTCRTPETSEGNQPQRPDVPQRRDVSGFPSFNAITGVDVCEGDTHFLGFGGVQVSEAEKATLTEISAALNFTA